MKLSAFVFSILLALTGAQIMAQTNSISSVAIAGGGVVTVRPRIGPDAAPLNNVPVANNLTGLVYVAGDLNLSGGPTSIAFYTLSGDTIPLAGGAADSFAGYGTISATPTPRTVYTDIPAKMTPDRYLGMTFAEDDLGLPSSRQFYMIHRRGATDYFARLVPRSGTASSIADLKPMSWPGGAAGGPADTGKTGYFALAYATYAGNWMYYLRTAGAADFAPAGNIVFGEMIPALASASTDRMNLNTAVGSFGVSGYTTMAFSPSSMGGNTTNQFYYLRLDAATGFTVLGRLDPTAGNRTISDIANLGGVYDTLTFAVDQTGTATGGGQQWGSTQLYATGTRGAAAQSISFAAISDKNAGIANAFPVTPTASSGLDLVVTVVSGPATVVATGPVGLNPSQRVFTVTPTGPGIVKLRATQSGGAFTLNFLEQSFNVLGPVTVQATPTKSLTVGIAAVSFTPVTSSGGTAPVTLSIFPLLANCTLSFNPTTGAITGTPTATAAATTYTVTATDATAATSSKTFVLTIGAALTANLAVASTTVPVNALIAPFTPVTPVGGSSPFTYAVTPLPTGLTLSGTTGQITGTPTVATATANYTVTITDNSSATATQAFSLTVSAPPVPAAPSITSPSTAAGTVGTAFVTYNIVATNSPTSYGATGLPPGLSLSGGAINGTPTTAGNYPVSLSATNGTGTSFATLTIAIGTAGASPNITNNPLTAAGTIGMPFSFTIAATGSPSGYSASGLPPGLSVNVSTGVISGTPTTAGVTVAAITATNGNGTDAATLTIAISAPGVAPAITNPSLVAAGTLGVPFSFTIAATGSPTSYSSFNLPPGLVLDSLTGVISGTPTSATTTFVTLTATNASGSTNATLMIVVAAAASVPVISSSATAPGVAGVPIVTYLIVATGLPTSYAATGLPPGLTLNALTGAINGTPTVPGTYVVTLTATNASGSNTAILTLVIAPSANFPASQIVNFAARAISGPGSESLIMGFVVAGDGTNLLVRGIGPGLTPHGVTNTLADPFLTLFNHAGAIATNDDWQTNTAGASNATLIAATAARVGAFALPAGSKDSALLLAVNSGAHTTGLVRPNGTTGVALTEIYDVDRNPGTRLVNVSARMNVTTGEGTLIAGLVIVGSAPNTVLIRGIGPTLSAFGVTGVLADPAIAVFSGSTQIASNDNWETGTNTAPQMIGAAAQVGAFSLQAGSKDAALLITLPPGNYSVQVTGVAGTTGVALVEVYDVP